MSKINESIVLVGGGGGVFRVARFLKHIRPHITTVQTVFDHGGHSGTLRDERGVLPPGDIRQAILALANDDMEPTLRKLMTHRFSHKGNSSLNGATMGNLLLTALTEIEGSLLGAIKVLCDFCKVRGSVLPVSLDNSELCVELSDGAILSGEGLIDTRSITDNRTIVRAFLAPTANIFVGAYDALVKADKIVLCPGDLYTSLLPNFLVNGFTDAVKESSAKIIYVVNIMTKHAETAGFDAGDFVKVVRQYLHRDIDVAICNSAMVDSTFRDKYALEKSNQVCSDGIYDYANTAILTDLLDVSGGIVRHHERVASVIAEC